MTGLSSVAGTPLQAQVQTASSDTTARNSQRGLSAGMFSTGQAVVTLLQSAVESIEFARAEADRQRTEAQVREDTKEAASPQPTDSTQTLGQSLDVTG